MRDQLLRLDNGSCDRLDAMREQQAVLDGARMRYERARRVYLGHVLAEFVGSGGTALPESQQAAAQLSADC